MCYFSTCRTDYTIFSSVYFYLTVDNELTCNIEKEHLKNNMLGGAISKAKAKLLLTLKILAINMNSKVKHEISFLASSITFEETQQRVSRDADLPEEAQKISKPEIRSSLRASTLEGVFATLFYSIIGGVLLSNFLLDLGASPVFIGLLASIPQLLNLFQPLGAYFADRSQSRRTWSIGIFLTSRLLWLAVALAIFWQGSFHIVENLFLVQLTLAIILITNIIEAFGRASCVSWMAALVPERLRGRYFGFRNSCINLMNLLAIPLLGFAVSKYPGGTVQGFGVVLIVGIVFGLISLGYQFLMTDINPKVEWLSNSNTEPKQGWQTILTFLKDANFLKFLLYSGLWSFAVNVSAPFFNLYLLDNLSIDVSVVTIYSSLQTGANLLMLIIWGKLADRVGNRPLLVVVGMLVALSPLLWQFGGTDTISLWIWFPLLHLLSGATWAAIDLCSANLLMTVAPRANRSIYFAIAAAVPGITGAMGIILGGEFTTLAGINGWDALFSLSAGLRFLALLPLVLVWEQRSIPLNQLWKMVFTPRTELTPVTPE
ncbi:major facilitator transporter [Calothrix sp. NIES-4071]|nr:major facilitator transporter [Calothrix sp. NIES-4071]BAZ54553.1 major facilitator transporter [Calothrix sp. NIES-4105]